MLPQYKDILQLLIEASGEVEEEDDEEVKTAPAECPAHQKQPPKKGVMTDKEVYGNAVGFLGAGNDTTAITLSFTFYLLAIHPDIQQRLQSEIDAYFDEKPVSTYIARYSIAGCIGMNLNHLLRRIQTSIQQLRRSHTLIRWCRRVYVCIPLDQSKRKN